MFETFFQSSVLPHHLLPLLHSEIISKLALDDIFALSNLHFSTHQENSFPSDFTKPIPDIPIFRPLHAFTDIILLIVHKASYTTTVHCPILNTTFRKIIPTPRLEPFYYICQTLFACSSSYKHTFSILLEIIICVMWPLIQTLLPSGSLCILSTTLIPYTLCPCRTLVPFILKYVQLPFV